jgi:hypothetical protein
MAQMLESAPGATFARIQNKHDSTEGKANSQISGCEAPTKDNISDTQGIPHAPPNYFNLLKATFAASLMGY